MSNKSKKLISAALAALAAAFALFLILRGESGRYMELTDEQAKKALSENVYESPEQRIVAEAAVSLKGRVSYFWGGKSRQVGWDDRWGEPALVESEGSGMSGTVSEFGLDCSGFVTWVFIQINDGRDQYGLIGDGTRSQWKKSMPIEWSDIKVGDLAFQNEYPEASSNHVGVCVGFYNGRPVFAHCASGSNTVVVTTAGELFKYARRPEIFN